MNYLHCCKRFPHLSLSEKMQLARRVNFVLKRAANDHCGIEGFPQTEALTDPVFTFEPHLLEHTGEGVGLKTQGWILRFDGYHVWGRDAESAVDELLAMLATNVHGALRQAQRATEMLAVLAPQTEAKSA